MRHWAVRTFTSESIWLCVCSLGLPRWRNLVVTGPEESVWTVVRDESGCVEG